METSGKSEQEDEFVDSSSDSILLDEWQDLSKSDYAKVIFCDLYHHPESGGVGCKFQITDNVHEDPSDSIGLFRVGYENLSQCLVSKILSNTECEDDGKLLRCMFSSEELPDLEDGFYQFLYITRDQEVCGASMPFEIKRALPKYETSSDDDVISERSEDGFIVVQLALEKKNQLLESLIEKYRSEINFLANNRDKISQEKDEIISKLKQEILTLKAGQQSLIFDSTEKLKKVELETSAIQMDNKKLKDELLVKLEKEKNSTDIISNLKQELLTLKAEQQIIVLESTDQLKKVELKTSSLQNENNELQETIKNLRLHLQQDGFMKEKTLQNIISNLNQEILQMKSQQHSVVADAAEQVRKVQLDTSTLRTVVDTQRLRIQLLEEQRLRRSIENERDEAISRNVLPLEGHILAEQLEDQKFMIKALEDSKQLAMKEMNDLSQSLSARNKALNQARSELRTCQSKLEESATVVEKNNEYIRNIKEELLQMKQVVGQKEDLLIQKTHHIQDIEKKLLQMKQLIAQKDVLFGEDYIQNLKEELLQMKLLLGQKEDLLIQQADKISTFNITMERQEGESNMTANEVEPLQGSSNVNMNWNKLFQQSMTRFSDLACLIDQLIDSTNFEDESEKKSFFELKTMVLIMMSKMRKKEVVRNQRKPGPVYYDCCDSTSGRSGLTTPSTGIAVDSAEEDDSILTLKKVRHLEVENRKTEEKIQEWKSKLESTVEGKEAVAKTLKKVKDLEVENRELKEKIQEWKSKLESEVEGKEAVAKLKEEILQKDTVIEALSAEKVNLLQQEVDLKKVNEEHSARIAEAAELYKTQYLEIQNLKKRIRQLQRSAVKSKANGYVSSSTAEDFPLKPSEKPPAWKRLRKTSVKSPEKFSKAKEIAFLPLSAEVIASLKRNISSELKTASANPFMSTEMESSSSTQGMSSVTFSSPLPPSDSDTGEHVLDTIAYKPTEVVNIVDNTEETKEKPVIEKDANIPCSTFFHPDLQGAQKFFSEELSKVRSQTTPSETAETYTIPCIICNKDCTVTSINEMDLINHLEDQHRINMCPICGHFFEAFVPERYFIEHVNCHFISD